MWQALREQGRFREELRGFRGKMEELTDKLNAVQNEIFKANEGMDAFKLQMNWNQVRAGKGAQEIGSIRCIGRAAANHGHWPVNQDASRLFM